MIGGHKSWDNKASRGGKLDFLFRRPVARLLRLVEDQRRLAEHEVGSHALAVRERRRVESHREEHQIRVGLQARVGLGARARLTNGATALARAHVRNGAAGGQRYAHAVAAARVRRAHVRALAVHAREAGRAVALGLEERQVTAAAAVQARV